MYVREPKDRIEMFLRNPVLYINAWMALKLNELRDKLNETKENDKK